MAVVDEQSQTVNIKIVHLDAPGGTSAEGRLRELHGGLPEAQRDALEEMALETGTLATFRWALSGPRIREFALKLHVYATGADGADDIAVVVRGADVLIVDAAHADQQLATAGADPATMPVVLDSGEDEAALLKEATRGAVRGLTGAGPSGHPSPPGATPQNRPIDVGGYVFNVPAWCPNAAVAVEPPVYRLDNVAANNTALVVTVCLGQARTMSVESLLASLLPMLGAESSAPVTGGEILALDGTLSHGCRTISPEAPDVETFVAVSGDDHLVAQLFYYPGATNTESLRRLYLAMIQNALARAR